MNDDQTLKRFILLRSQGWSFNQIAAELNVSKPTLIKWSRQHQFEIANLRATETEAMTERIFGARQQRWERLAAELKKIDAEIDRRDLEELPASTLYGIAARLRAEIQRCVGGVQFSETNSAIPHDEYVIAKHEWPG
jgi:hypothetical protein